MAGRGRGAAPAESAVCVVTLDRNAAAAILEDFILIELPSAATAPGFLAHRKEVVNQTVRHALRLVLVQAITTLPVGEISKTV